MTYLKIENPGVCPIEGFILLARSQNLQPDYIPTVALQYLKAAYDRAAAYGFLDSVRAEVNEVFKASLAIIEARLALAEKDKLTWRISQLTQTLIRQLNADLKLALPPRLSKALANK